MKSDIFVEFSNTLTKTIRIKFHSRKSLGFKAVTFLRLFIILPILKNILFTHSATFPLTMMMMMMI